MTKTFTPLIGAASVAVAHLDPVTPTIPIWSFALIAYSVIPIAVFLATRARRACLGALFKHKEFASGPAWRNHAFRATVCTAALILWPIVVLGDWLHGKKCLWDELRERARRKHEGIRKRQNSDIVVDSTEWYPRSNHLLTNWVEGEIHQLLPGDIVLQFWRQWGPLAGEGGYAIERNGRIVAEHIAGVS
jgi:hypothetical protein